MKIIAFVLAAIVSASTALAQSTAFSFQGSLKDNGQPAAGLHDFRFKLFDAAGAGTQIGTTQCVDNLQVAEGRFTATLDFGNQFTTPSQRYIEIEVRRDTGLNCSNAGGFVVLSPRQLVTAAPTATHAKSAFSLDAANGSVANAVFVDNTGNVGVGTMTPANRLSVAGNANIAGNVGIGTTTPGVPLHIVSTSPVPAIHVASPFAVMNLQDTGSNSNQTGYVSYRNATGTETAWIGFGSAGDPDFSIINARAGGDIVLNTLGGGKVGIGTATPGAALDVRGDIRLGPSGQYRATAGDENLRIVRGEVGPTGAVIAGSGFSVANIDIGKFQITFTTPFASRPIVTATPYRGINEAEMIVMIESISSTGAVLVTRNAAFATSEWIGHTFDFIAVGPR